MDHTVTGTTARVKRDPSELEGAVVTADHGPDGRRLQPWLHDLVVALAAPTQVWSGPDGQVRAQGAQGAYHGDVRVLSRAELTVDGVEPAPVLVSADGAGGAVAVGVARLLGDPGPDPTVRVDRHRTVLPGRMKEVIVVESSAKAPVTTRVRLALEADLAPMDLVKSGERPAPKPSTLADGQVTWTGLGLAVGVAAPGANLSADGDAAALTWDVTLEPGERVELTWTLRAHDERAVVAAPATADGWDVDVQADDRRLGRWMARAVDDLRALRLVTTARPEEVFLAAGAPWFLTLFGRDSLWAARMLLPLGTELAGSTLRLLASHQGTRVDASSAEEPGKILHELRRDALELPHDPAGALHLPPVYYGTVDATALWAVLLHEAWRWGMPEAEVAPLVPTLELGLEWMVTHGDPDGDGFCEYVDRAGTGLANQGWKDSGDSVQWRDGSLARAPIALCEVQGYAYQAAVGGAELLDHFGRPGGDRWREWADGLADRFRSRFWVGDDDGPYPAIALDADKRPVDSLTSNVGHLIGTGLLSADEEAELARRLISPQMSSGFGLRTLATTAAGYSALSYHGGSIWPHDTAIVLAGMAAGGHDEGAAVLAEGLLAAAHEFDGRLPELYGGDARTEVPVPVPYPAACRPQAWSATAAVAVLTAVTGLRPHVPAGSTALSPLTPSPVGALRARGLRLAGRRVGVDVDPDGKATLVED